MAGLRRVLVVNAGSSTLKLTVVGASDVVVGARDVDPWDGRDVRPLVDFVADVGEAVDAVGHRVVHGGTDFVGPLVVDGDVEARLDALVPLAPLHQPRALAGIRAARSALPDVPAVACFDTAFHAGLPDVAATYAVPEEWRDRYGVRRFGFHGLSHGRAVRRAAEMAGRVGDPDFRVVSCHLGAGASLCAARGGRSVDTTMGFTPLEGLVMQTRAGSVDPGLVLWLVTEAGIPASEVRERLEEDSGLAALSGGSGDLRDIVAARDADARAQLAFDVYVRRLAQGIAAMAVSAGGIDALVFTGGVGEHIPEVRAAALGQLPFLGLAIDPAANEGARPDASVGGGHGPEVFVVTSREDLEIARQARSVLRAPTPTPTPTSTPTRTVAP